MNQSATMSTVLHFSPSKASISAASPQRIIQPSPEKKCLPSTTVILSKKEATALESPVKKRKSDIGLVLDAQFDIELGRESRESKTFQDTLATSKIIELDYPLIMNGRSWGPPDGRDFTELLYLFPTTFAVEITSGFLIIRVHTLPPKPWPLTIGGLPVRFTTGKFDICFDYGKCGKGPKALDDLDLQRVHEFSEDILRRVMVFFQDAKIKIRSIFWLGNFWQVTLIDPVDLKVLPWTIASQGIQYKFASEIAYPDPSALRNKVPQGVEFDNTLYASSPNALLRPGIMLGSSIVTVTEDGKTEELFKTTTSGILVANRRGDLFITVATNGFENDGLVYHPNPRSGILIGKISHSLPGTDISFAKLNPGLRYINENFGSTNNPLGARANGITPGQPPRLRQFDPCSMNNPFSGRCDGQVRALGIEIPEGGDTKYVEHVWCSFENGDEPIDGSCGSPIIHENGDLIGFFRYKMDANYCYAVSAKTLKEHGYEVCGGERTF